MTESEGVTQDQIVEFGWPNAAVAMPVGKKIKVVADGSAINAQVDNVSTPKTNERFRKITALLPGLSANATKVLSIYASDDALPTGTAITIADVQAMAGYADGALVVEITDEAGTVFTASAKAIFDASNTTFSKSAKWTCPDLWRSGPFCTEWRLRMAPLNGSTAHGATGAGPGDGIHVEMHVAAYKASAAAVSGGNPIIALRGYVLPQNEDLQRFLTSGAAKNHWYGLAIKRATSVSDATLISTDQTTHPYGKHRMVYANSAPALTVTLSGANGVGSLGTATLSSGSWDADIIGAHIHNTAGAGKVIVRDRVSNTVANVIAYEGWANGASTSGNWKVYGVGHAPNTRYFVPVWIGARPTIVGAHGTHASAITPTTNAVEDYLSSSEMILETALGYSDVNHATGIAALDLMKAPDGTMRPLTIRGIGNTVFSGEVSTDLGGTGSRQDIAWMPLWHTHGLLKYDTNGRRRIFENARHWNWQFNAPVRLSGSPAAGNLALPPRADCGTTNIGISLKMNLNVYNIPSGAFWPFDGDTAHQPAGPYVPYLLTGDYHWLQWLSQQETSTCWMACQESVPPLYGNGSGSKRGWMGEIPANGGIDEFGSVQTRGKAWAGRDQQTVAAVEPDNERLWLTNGKTYIRARMASAAASAVYWLNTANFANGDYTTGLVIDPIANDFPQLPGIWDAAQFKLHFSTPWTMGFLATTVGAMKYLDLDNANWEQYALWLLRYWNDSYLNAGVVADIHSDTFQHVWAIRGTIGTPDWPAYPANQAELYRRTCMVGPTNTSGWGEYRQMTGTLALSAATVGTGRTATFSVPQFSGGGTGSSAWYVGGWIRNHRSGVLPFTGRTGAFTVGETVSITVTFSGATRTATVAAILSDDGTSGELLLDASTATFSEYFAPGATIVGSMGGGAVVQYGSLIEKFNWSHARITSVISPTQLEIEIYVPFASTSPAATEIYIPGPHPTDYAGSREPIQGVAFPYQQRGGVAALTKFAGPLATSGFINYIEGRTNFTPKTVEPQAYWVPRP